MRRTALGGLVVAALLVAGTFAAHGSASGTGHARPDATTLRFDVQFSPFKLIDVDHNGRVSDGDQIVFHDKLFIRGNQVGDDLGTASSSTRR